MLFSLAYKNRKDKSARQKMLADMSADKSALTLLHLFSIHVFISKMSTYWPVHLGLYCRPTFLYRQISPTKCVVG